MDDRGYGDSLKPRKAKLLTPKEVEELKDQHVEAMRRSPPVRKQTMQEMINIGDMGWENW